uniref:RING-type domain-containing protein n=1 Tax=Peronospora matthiolae TaxID=2874970 RepID=A0AAV1T241_9STRA
MAVVSCKCLPQALQLAIADAARRRCPPSPFRCPQEDLLCAICFDILCFPVTLPCGHNFDRGCILTAWAHGSALLSPSRRAPGLSQCAHLCPLCRQQSGVHSAEELQVNLLLKTLIASLYPAETQVATIPAKQQGPPVMLLPTLPPRTNGGGALTTDTAASAFRRRPSLRTFSSFIYVCAASVTDPPGFILAVLLLLILVATACSPQPATAPPTASAMMMFDTMDRVCNGLSFVIHRISMQMDQLDQLSPWIRLLS